MKRDSTNEVLSAAMVAAILAMAIAVCSFGGALSKRASDSAVVEHRKAQQGARR